MAELGPPTEDGGPPPALTDEELKQELTKLGKDDLVAMVLEARRDKAVIEKRGLELGNAFQHAQRSLHDLEDEAEEVQHAHERELGLFFDESLSLRAEMDFDSTSLSLENHRLKDQLASYVVLQEQNAKLKEMLEKMHESALSAQEAHAKEMEDLRESISHMQDKLHREFRARLHKLNGEVSEAMAGSGDKPGQSQMNMAALNATKQQETDSHIKVMMEKYLQLEAEHDKVKLAHGLVQQSMEYQTKEMLHRKRELLESRERCASLTHDLRHAKSVMDKMKTEIRTVKALKEQLYDVEMQTRRLKEQVTANMRDKLQWKTRALKLKKEVKKAQETAARTRAKPDGAEKGGGIGGSGWVAGGTGRTASRPGEILPVVTRGQTGYAQGDEVQHSKTLKSVDFGDSASDDEEWGEQEDLGDSPVKGLHHGDGHDGNVGRSGASTSPVMNFSRVYSRARSSATAVLPEDDDEDVQRIWSARFVSQEGGVRMGAGIGGEDEVGRSESAPPRRVDMTRSGSSLGIGNNAQLYLPPGPRGIDGRKTDPGKMFSVSIPGKSKKPKSSNARFLNFI